jgi:3-phosphoshikimate 1-carboxyvinyltransferase
MSSSTTRWTVRPSSLRAARLRPPVSKSDAQRALVLAHILRRPDWVDLGSDEGELPSDVQALNQGLQQLARAGTGTQDIDCRDGGAPFRLLLGQAAATPGAHVLFRGTPRLGERPHGPLMDSLRGALGPSGLVIREGAPWPLELRAPESTQAAEPVFRVAAAESSQFASSLVLAAAALYRREGRAWTVELDGPVASEGYLGLTLTWLLRTGFTVERRGHALSVTGWREPPSPPLIPGDWSSLGYLTLVAWRTGGTVLKADPEAAHPDRAILRVLGEVGLTVREVEKGELSITGDPTRGFTVSGHECPDLLPTLAVLACVLPGESRLEAVEILKAKESDRLTGILELCATAGATTAREGDTLVIRPPAKVRAQLAMDSHGDHRLAMSAATLAVLSGSELSLTGPEVVSKSFPGFWRQLEAAGVTTVTGA